MKNLMEQLLQENPCPECRLPFTHISEPWESDDEHHVQAWLGCPQQHLRMFTIYRTIKNGAVVDLKLISITGEL
jgi:hypothetical protein